MMVAIAVMMMKMKTALVKMIMVTMIKWRQ